MDKKRLMELAGIQLNEIYQVENEFQQIIQEAINDVLRSTVQGELSAEDRDRIIQEAIDKYQMGK
ncbi:hypothetical protein LCGC14_1533970 [marine sediment metagenome]|uniref:Uncharacterized protein n=1 Tax=marine sediment metagenome TaxID=412755 RepID=A0A0F9IV55_9ZZZZ